ncbi:Hypothetical predicted protein [Olea europaea subsp. europaea]|uniref:Mitochondrial import inner membrane translocase subunit TIM50 n=1 Tax=Olea europaea subsp. europaea TaxID=158383 RepID=A0A8S0SZH7_OLEEU|nr:Hypothetical predicted protein [Olea europaea subsp. europaea]
MASKIVKRTPTKSIKNRRKLTQQCCRSQKRSPIKNASTTASASVLALPPPKKTPHKKRYQILQKDHADPPNSTRRSMFNDMIPLPPLLSPKKETIFLDLDETLVHFKPELPPEKYNFIVRPVFDGEKVEFYVLRRPFVDEFLDFLSQRFGIVVLTAGIYEDASLVLDSPDNAIPFRPIVDDLEDGELKKLIKFFEGCDSIEDISDALKFYLADQEEEKKVEA